MLAPRRLALRWEIRVLSGQLGALRPKLTDTP